MLNDEHEAANMNVLGTTSTSIGTEYSTAQEQAAKYEPHADKIDTSVLGDNFGIVNHYHNSPSLSEIAQFLNELGLRMRLGEELQDIASTDEVESDSVPEQVDSSEMPPDIDEWFYKLDDYERYYVVTVALLHGAPATDVSLKAKELYQSSRSATGLQRADDQGLIEGAIPSHSTRKLRNRTYTITSQAGGVERLFWQNAEFGAQVLRFIAEESIEWPGSQPGQSFLDMLQKWPEELKGECTRRSARALGVILVYQSTNQLWRVANTWANSESERHWRLAALLLSGAYDAGCLEVDKKMGNSMKDSVLRLLKQWTERFVQLANTRVASAAVRTYSLLGRQSPDIALDGLEQLLQMPLRATESAQPDELISAIVSAYVALTWSGQIRLVLDALALHVERWSHQCYLPAKEYQRYRHHREIVLNVTFDAFFLIAASSLTAKRDDLSIRYSTSELLPEYPVIPNPSGRDVLLAGLLSQSETSWYRDLSMLLCAAIIEKKNKIAFDLVRQWADSVADQQGEEARTIYAAFVNFTVNIGQRLKEWCQDLEGRGIRRRAVETFRHKFINWMDGEHTHQTSIGKFAQDILLSIDR